MGKSQKKKAMRRHNPMRVPDSHLPKGLAAASSTSTKTEAILPIIQKMESPDPDERKWACVAVSNIIQNDPSTRRLLQGKNVVGALITRLTDSEEEVMTEAMGALRNLCIDGGYDICAEMYNKNIITPLKSFVAKISATLSASIDDLPKNTTIHSFADNVITTIWCLSETSNKALGAINAMNLVPFLMAFITSRDKLALATVTAAAQCLYVLTDDNSPAITEVRTNANFIAALLSIAQPNGTAPPIGAMPLDMNGQRLQTLTVLATGILKNISPVPQASSLSQVDVDREIVLPALQPVISSISLEEVSNATQDLITRQASEPHLEKPSLKKSPGSDHKSPIELELDLLESKLRTVQLALEVLTGACATLPEPDFEAEIEEDEGAEMENDLDNDEDLPDTEADGMDVEPSTNNTSNALLPPLVIPLIALIHPTSLSFPPLAAASPHPPITSALSALHVSALECLNNIFLALSSSKNPAISQDKVAGCQIWDGIWRALGVVGTETGLGQERRKEMWEIAIGVLWGVGNVWQGSITPNEHQVQLLTQLYVSTTDTQLKVKCIGTLESLGHFPATDSNKVVGSYLLSLLPTTSPVTDVEPVLQATSALIDIYSDENSVYDINFRQGGYIQQLSVSVDHLKRAVKAIDRRKPGGRELRQRGELVLENLVAFIQYRRDLGL